MITKFCGAWIGRFLVAAVVGLGLAGAGAASAQPADSSSLPVEEVERIVREYLLREPEVLYQALQELQKRQAEAAAQRQREAIAANRENLYHDPNDPTGGDPEGAVTLVEFFDYRCTYCRRVVSSLQALLDDEQDLKVVFKEFPVLGEDSVRAARAALASRRQDRYLPFHFALMQADDLSEDGIRRLAGELGLNPDQLARDMDAPEIEQELQENYRLAEALGIEGTPAFVIGDQLIPGAIGLAQLRALVAEARKQG